MNGVRFAPSPTGRFHIGNLRTAWIASQVGHLLAEPLTIRVEDIDSARSRIEFKDLQIADLKRVGVIADELIIQSNRHSRHLELFNRARNDGLIYPCDCSRKDVLEALAGLRSAPHGREADYSGRCRTRKPSDMHPVETLAWRWRSKLNADGRYDAIVARTNPDGSQFTPGYHWACAIDDADGNYRLLVRAWDLETVEFTQRQIREWVRPNIQTDIFHTSLVVNLDGSRLEKRTKGVTLDELTAAGLTEQTLVSLFERSFPVDVRQLNELMKNKGEIEQTISLDTLLER